jgi:hypothetical protein
VPEVSSHKAPVRGTQSFIHILRDCWRRPSLLALEVLWRWLFGIPYCYLLYLQFSRIYLENAQTIAKTGIWQASIIYPEKVAVILANLYDILAAPIFHLLIWIIPLGMIVWAVFSGIGRNTVLRRYDKSLPRRWGVLTILQLLRVVFYGGSIVFWFSAIHWSARVTLWGDSPSIVAYCTLVICFSLGTFTAWALVSWVFSIAPVLALLEGRGILSSLARSLRLGPLTGKLVEINLIMGIIKLALTVLALVWSAIPLPFEAVVQGNSLYAWWVVGTILYCILSDFFQVARLAAFIEFWRAFQNQNRVATSMQ